MDRNELIDAKDKLYQRKQVMNLKPQNELKAPKGKFRVIGVDTFEAPNADYIIGDFANKIIAIQKAKERGGTMNRTYVYDDKGKEISGGFGTY